MLGARGYGRHMQHVAVKVVDGIATITLRRPKVNAMNSQLLRELRDAFADVEQNASVVGALITGDGPCLSAGLDLKEVATLDVPGASDFVELMDGAFDAAFRMSKPLAVAVQGHAIAGGLVIAMCADYMALATGDYRVGLTELAVGVPFPRVAWEIVRTGIPPRALRKLVNEAGTHPPAEVFAWGVGDVLVPDAIAAAQSWLELVTSRPLDTFRVVKALMRKEAWERIDDYVAEGPDGAERTRLLETLLATRQPLHP